MDLSLEIERVYQRALLLRERATELPVQPDLVEEALKELLFVLEELQTSQEEMRHQNQELIATRQAVELERQRYQALFELAPNGYLVTDRQGKIYQANRAAADLFSIPQEYLIKKPLVVLIHEPDRPLFQTRLVNLNQVQDWEVSLNPRNGVTRSVAIAFTQIKGVRGEKDTLLWSLRDITLKKQMEQLNHSLAYFDSLTTLPNRHLLLDRIKNTLSVAKRGGHYGAILFIDLDRFKTLNDTRLADIR